MAIEKSGYRIASDVNLQSHERSEFPILCETCLGDSPYVRMTKEPSGKECKICSRPYCVFRWKPGPKARFKQTIICQTCAKLKNVCQTCLFDLEYGLPVQVRDKYLKDSQKLELPEAHVNKNYLANQLDAMAAKELPYGQSLSNPVLDRLARHSPYYRRNRPRVCSFWQRNSCSRGDSCPFMHEEEKHDPELANQKIKDRYIGQDDPVADKIMRRAESNSTPQSPPEDQAITTLFLAGLPSETTDSDLRAQFYTFGEIQTIKMVPRQKCAFVTFVARKAAEDAMEALSNRLTVRNSPVRLLWGRQSAVNPNSSTSLSGCLYPDQFEYTQAEADELANSAATFAAFSSSQIPSTHSTHGASFPSPYHSLAAFSTPSLSSSSPPPPSSSSPSSFSSFSSFSSTHLSNASTSSALPFPSHPSASVDAPPPPPLLRIPPPPPPAPYPTAMSPFLPM